MKNHSFIIILGSFQENTFQIVHSIIDFLDLQNEIYVPQYEPRILNQNLFVGNLIFKSFDWKNFQETFSSLEHETENNHKTVSILMLSPKVNLADQFQKLYDIHEQVILNIQKIIAIIDGDYFDDGHENLLGAMAHFSDILLIDNRIKIDHIQLENFQEHFQQKECYPLSIKILNRSSVEHIPELFDNSPKRMTLIFDDLNPIDLVDEKMITAEPFTIPTLVQHDRYLKKDDRGQYCLPIELL